MVEGYMDVPPENMLSLPIIDGETVEKVVPLAARVDIEGRWRWLKAALFDEVLVRVS